METKHIVLAVDGEPHAINTANYAIYLAKSFNAKLTAIFVVNQKVIQFLLVQKIFVQMEAGQYKSELEEFGMHFLERIKKLAEQESVSCKCLLLSGIVSEEVTRVAKETSADMLVIGGSAESPSQPTCIYDKGAMIIWKSPCTVVIVKNPHTSVSFNS